MKIRFGKHKDQTPQEVLQSENGESELRGIIGFLEKQTDERFRENNEKLIAEIKDVLAHSSVKFTCGEYEGKTPQEVLSESEEPEVTIAEFRKLYKTIDDDPALQKAIVSAVSAYSAPATSADSSTSKKNKEKNKDAGSIADDFRNGSLLRTYGSSVILNVYPAFPINKIRITLIKKGSEGKNALDFYMSTDDFYALCMDIDSGVIESKLKAGISYVSGENGCKRLNISQGNKGILININISGNKLAMAVGMDVLKKVSFRYKLISGLMPVGYYYKSLADLYWKSANQYEHKES